MSRLAVIVICVAAGCVELGPPRVTVRSGPAAERSIARVVVLPATCGTLLERPRTSIEAFRDTSGCPVDAVKGLDAVVRAELAFRGLDVIDAEQVNAITATRRETRRGDSVERDGVEARFLDATYGEQQVILDELRADGVVTTRMWLAPHEVTVQLRLVTAADRAVAWIRRCEVPIDSLQTDVSWLRDATRCALGEDRR